LSPKYLWPLSFASGFIVTSILIADWDFLTWILYQRHGGTIYLSALVTELLLLLLTFEITLRALKRGEIAVSQNGSLSAYWFSW
jgi:hypothetical protein